MAQLPPLVRSYQALQEGDVADSTIPHQVAQGDIFTFKIQDYDSETDSDKRTGLLEAQWKLVNVVKELAEALTSDADATRARGVLLLSEVVIKMDKSVLDRQMTKTLTTFFVDKLSEKASLVPCATALTELVKAPTFGTGEGMEVARGILSSVNLKSHPQAIRHSVYVLLDHLMTHARPALQRLGSDFISGYCSLVEGEKDPRNLMISFSLVKVVLLEFDTAKNIEELFDITFCYFPITFTPPPDDPYGISSEDLIIALRGCLSATALLGPLALPLFFDKLQAASEKAKRQTLQALVACFPIYGAAACGEWAGRFSEALIIEVFHASDTDMQNLALLAVRALYSTLYPDPSAAATATGNDEDTEMDTEGSRAIEGVAMKMVQNSLDELKEPDKNNAKPAARILTALICSSDRLARYVLDQSLPPLLELYKSQDEIALRPSVLSHLATLLSSLSEFDDAPTDDPLPPKELRTPPRFSYADGASPLEPFRDDLLSILTGSTRALTCRLPALEGLLALVRIPQFLTPGEIEFSISAINEVLMRPDGDEYYDAALDALVVIARMYPRVIENLTLPLLLATLPTAPLPLPGSAESDDYRRALEALAALCIHPDLFEILVLRLLARLDETLAISAPVGSSDYTAATLYAHHLLATLRAVIQEKIKRGHVDVAKYIESFVPRLSALLILPTTFALAAPDASRPVATDPRLVLDAGRVVNLIVQRVEAERQTTLSHAVNEAFHRGNLQPYLSAAASGSGPVPFRPFETSSPTSQRNLTALFSALLLAMKPAVALPVEDLLAFVRSTLERTLSAQNELQLAATVHLLGSTINKRAQDLADFLDTDVDGFFRSTVSSSSTPTTPRRSALRAYSWIAKGLIVRSDQRGYAMVERILDLFHDSELNTAAAASLGVIAEEKDGVLGKENAAVIRLLYRQRFFTYLLPKLVDLYKTSTAEGDAKNIYLVALASLLRHIPKQLTLTELPKLLPLLITSLDLPDASLRANVVDALTVLVNDVPAELENSISGITTKVLRGLTVASAERDVPAETKLRIASLAFLSSLPAHIPYLVLHSQKPVILKDLGRALDDPRREVRRAAVECRSQWFLYTG
ncbi:hypothetical protein JCM10908_005818 [Rhodotorula pacifica]|uniref:Met18p n=1 Tax=Rhodotorula pacifica TaxID=1495444 RepID=UPI00317F2AC9